VVLAYESVFDQMANAVLRLPVERFDQWPGSSFTIERHTRRLKSTVMYSGVTGGIL
jgi:hypothetical protein